MRILVTNDDGVGAEGLRRLVDALAGRHEVWAVAPDRERSGNSHGLSLGLPCVLKRVSERAFSCSGTPADCVVLAQLGAIGFRPDVVVAGINRGPNLGTDIVYSGTCAAAREAVISGTPGIAVSCSTWESPFLYGAAAAFVLRNIDTLLASCPRGCFVNVNAPSSDDEGLRGKLCPPCRRIYGNELKSFDAPDGSSYCFITGGAGGVGGEVPNDSSVVAEGLVAVSYIEAYPLEAPGLTQGQEFD